MSRSKAEPATRATEPDPSAPSEELAPEIREAAVSSGEIVTLLDQVADVPEHDRGPMTGRLIQGRYLIKGLLGEGGMGAVYRAEHTLMGKEMAIKVLLPEYGEVDGLAKRFQQEAQSASRLEHPGIIQVFDFGHTEEGQLFLAMAFLDGLSLTQVIHRHAPMPPERAIPIVVQMCEALEHAHSEGVVHRDMKPDNVIVVQKDGMEVAKLLDFGIARVTEGEGAAKGMTQAGMVFGTPEYLSPEQGAGDPADARADLYAVGVILYEMLAGRKPFVSDSGVQYITMHMHHPPPPFAEAAPELALPAVLEEVVMRSLAKSPAERYQSGRDFAEALLTLQLVQYAAPSAGTSVRTIPPAVQANVAAATAEVSGLHPMPQGALAPQTSTLPPATHDGPAVNKAVKVWGLVALGLILFLLVVLLAVIVGNDGSSSKKDGDGRSAAALRDAGAVKALDAEAELQAIQGLLSAEQLDEAEKKLQQLISGAPRNPRVHLLFGHLHCRRLKREACLGSYQAAILLTPAMREDALLLKNVGKLLRRRKGRKWGRPDREATVAFVVGALLGAGDLGARARKTVVTWVNQWWEHDLIWKAIEALAKRKNDAEVDYVHAYRQRFKSVRDCATRETYLVEIAKRGDKKFLPLLLQIHKTASFRRPYSRVRVPNECIRTAAAEALVKLGGKLPETPAPTMTVRSRRRTSRGRKRRRKR